MRLAIAVALASCVGACGEGKSEAEIAQENALASEMVRDANEAAPILVDVVPEAILYPDIERYDIFGQACSYAPGTSMGARVIARQADAFMKVEGEVLRFVADPGSRELPMRSRSLYNGREYSLRLAIEGEGTPEEGSTESTLYEGTVYLRDRWDRVVYQGTGAVSCGS